MSRRDSRSRKQVLTGDAGLAVGLFVVAAELALQDAIHVAQLLLLAQLDEVLGLAGAASTVLAWRIWLAFVAQFFDWHKLDSCAAAWLAGWSGVASH